MVGPVAHSKHTSLLLGWPIPSRFSPQASEGWDTLLPARHALTPLTPFTLSPLFCLLTNSNKYGTITLKLRPYMSPCSSRVTLHQPLPLSGFAANPTFRSEPCVFCSF